MPGSGLFNAMFTIVPLFIGFVFVIVVGSILVNLVKGVTQWSDNNAQPVESVDARVAGKRMQVNGTEQRTTTDYFVTFEPTSGERREFSVSGPEYGLLSEGDAGQLRHQGTRYLGFERRDEPEPPPARRESEGLVCEYCGALNAATAHKCASCGSGKLAPPVPKAES